MQVLGTRGTQSLTSSEKTQASPNYSNIVYAPTRNDAIKAEKEGLKVGINKSIFNMVVEYHRQFGMIKELPTEQADRISYVKAFWTRLVIRNPYFPPKYNSEFVASMFFEDVIIGNVPNIFPNLRSQIGAFRTWYSTRHGLVAEEHERAFPSKSKRLPKEASRLTPEGCLNLTKEETVDSIKAIQQLRSEDWAGLLQNTPTDYYKELRRTAEHYNIEFNI